MTYPRDIAHILTYLRVLISLTSGTNANISGRTYENTNDGIGTPNKRNASEDASNIGQNRSNKDIMVQIVF